MSTQDTAAALDRLREGVGRTITGYDDVVTDLLVGLLSDGHVLLEGVPGVAKTTLAKAFAETSGLDFKRVQFTQDLLPSDVTGHYFFNQKRDDFEVRKGPVFANVVLADEINRAPPKAQSALLESMQERQVTIEGTTFPVPEPFLVIATMNPVDVDGVYRLPDAQLDRFMIRTRMTYLTPEREREMLRHAVNGHDDAAPARLDAKVIAEARRAVKSVHVAPEIVDYAHAVADATRAHPAITLGASPRAMRHLLAAARALALLDGRDYTIPDDVKAAAPRVLNHRLVLSVDADVDGTSVDAVTQEILGRVDVPKHLATG